MHRISIIIPVLNDKEVLYALLKHLLAMENRAYTEVLVVDGGSTETPYFVNEFDAQLLEATSRGRAVQMNTGAKHAHYEILYFLHADTLPPPSLVMDINQALKQGKSVGCFRLKLNPGSLLLNINSFLSRYRSPFSGGGDQSLYLPKKVFMDHDGYNKDFPIMEDFELVHRLIPLYGYHIIPKNILASSRKYTNNSYFKVNWANYRAFRLYREGADPDEIKRKYDEWLKPRFIA